MKSVRYVLWAMPIDDETIVFATENEFARVGDNRVLVYLPDEKEAKKSLPKSAVSIPDDVARVVLTDGEARWLTKCNITVIERVADTYRLPIEKTIPNFLERLKTELENIRRAKDAKEEEEYTDPEGE